MYFCGERERERKREREREREREMGLIRLAKNTWSETNKHPIPH